MKPPVGRVGCGSFNSGMEGEITCRVRKTGSTEIPSYKVIMLHCRRHCYYLSVMEDHTLGEILKSFQFLKMPYKIMLEKTASLELSGTNLSGKMVFVVARQFSGVNNLSPNCWNVCWMDNETSWCPGDQYSFCLMKDHLSSQFLSYSFCELYLPFFSVYKTHNIISRAIYGGE